MTTASRVLARVTAREPVGPMTLLRLHVPGWRAAGAGQFAMLQTERSSRFLPRAFSVASQSRESVDFLIAPVGSGTAELARARVGEGVWVLGPLGRGFDLGAMLRLAEDPEDGTSAPRLVIVAGGVGVAPFPVLLADVARVSPACWEVLVLLGFRDAEQARAAGLLSGHASEARRRGTTVRVELVTEDGSVGRQGLVTTLVSDEVRAGDVVAGCGSPGMCEAVWRVSRERGAAAVWLSLEAPMACGVGSCQGCVIPLADGSLARVCRRGPVFSGDEVFGAGVSGSPSCSVEDPEGEGW